MITTLSTKAGYLGEEIRDGFQLAIDQERNVSRVAARLSLTQPTVSGMLNRLRDMFDDPLFIRAQRGVLPTPRAQALAEPLKQWLADANALVRPAIFDPKLTELTFTISVNDYLQYALIVPLVGVLRREAPNIRLAIKPVIADLSRALMRGEIDLAVTIPEVVPPEARSYLLYKERYIGVVRSEHPLAGAAISLEDFCRYEHVLVSPTGGAFEGTTDQVDLEFAVTEAPAGNLAFGAGFSQSQGIVVQTSIGFFEIDAVLRW